MWLPARAWWAVRHGRSDAPDAWKPQVSIKRFYPLGFARRLVIILLFADGPTLGIGLQHTITGHLTARLQLDYYNYGKVEYDMPGSPEVDSNVAVVKIGIDYYL
jgi:hypothetical protein